MAFLSQCLDSWFACTRRFRGHIRALDIDKDRHASCDGRVPASMNAAALTAMGDHNWLAGWLAGGLAGCPHDVLDPQI